MCCGFEAATNNFSQDYNINKAVANLEELREEMQGITNRYQEVQQDILETFLDRGELRKLAEPTVLASGKRIPGLKLDHPRQLAVMHSVYVSPMWLPGVPSPPQNCGWAQPKPWASKATLVRWGRYAMSSGSCAPKA